MAITNYERVGKAMELLKAGLAPFVEREFKNLYKGQTLVEAQRFMISERLDTSRPLAAWDVAALLRLMCSQLPTFFHLGRHRTHNTVHGREITEMLKASPQDFRPRSIASTTPDKSAELSNPLDRLAKRRRLGRRLRAPASHRAPTARYRAPQGPSEPTWWHTEPATPPHYRATDNA